MRPRTRGCFVGFTVRRIAVSLEANNKLRSPLATQIAVAFIHCSWSSDVMLNPKPGPININAKALK